jgi:hypothetical protein
MSEEDKDDANVTGHPTDGEPGIEFDEFWEAEFLRTGKSRLCLVCYQSVERLWVRVGRTPWRPRLPSPSGTRVVHPLSRGCRLAHLRPESRIRRNASAERVRRIIRMGRMGKEPQPKKGGSPCVEGPAA